VLDEFAGFVDEWDVPTRNCRQRQHDQMHEEIDQSAIIKAGENGAANEDREFAAGKK
jgi:hypothetical protein